MAYEVNCQKKRKNTGISQFCQDIGPISGYIITPYNFELSENDIRDESKIIELIHANVSSRIYPFPQVASMTDNSEDTVFEELPLGNLFVKDGKVSIAFMHESSRYKHEALKSHSLQKVGVILIDQQGRMHGVREDNMFQSIKLQQFVVGRLMINDGSGAATKTTVTMVFADTNKWETSPAVVSGLDWFPNDLQGLTDLNLSVVSGSVSTGGLVLEIKADKTGTPFNAAGPSIPLNGDVVIKKAGVVQTITSLTASGGLNTIVATLTAGLHTIDLYPPAIMVTKGYESTGSVNFTVS